VERRLDDRAQHSDRSRVGGDRARGGPGRAVGVEGPALESDRCCLIVAEQRHSPAPLARRARPTPCTRATRRNDEGWG